MKNKKINWTNDRFEDYESETDWIESYPDNPCPSCGCPSVKDGAICFQCGE